MLSQPASGEILLLPLVVVTGIFLKKQKLSAFFLSGMPVR